MTHALQMQFLFSNSKYGILEMIKSLVARNCCIEMHDTFAQGKSTRKVDGLQGIASAAALAKTQYTHGNGTMQH